MWGIIIGNINGQYSKAKLLIFEHNLPRPKMKGSKPEWDNPLQY